jgi:putative transposase
VAKEASHTPVTLMCQVLGLARASYYRWRTRQTAPPSPRAQRHAEVTRAIVATFAETQQRVGRRPMRQLLAADGMVCSAGMVHTIMAEQQLVARRRRAWKRTTGRDPAARTPHIGNHCLDRSNHRRFHSDQPGAVTVGDITYLPTKEGWLYLAVVLDLASRAVIGWALRPTLQTELVSVALTMAHQHGYLRPGAIFHSDRGSQYTSQTFQTVCAALEVTQSMGATGVCWDNAVAEAFFATLKSDLATEVGTFATRAAARAWVLRYIEGWYNRRRPHAANQGRPPLVALDHLSAQLAVSVS